MANTQTKNQKIRQASVVTVKIDIWTKIASIAYKLNKIASDKIFKHMATRDSILDEVVRCSSSENK